MATIKVRFINSKGFVSSAIDFFEGGSEFCHVEFIFDADEQKALGITGPYVGAHADGGIRAYDDVYYSGHNVITRERAYSLTVTDEQYKDITDFVKVRIGTPYDFHDIIGIMFHKDWHTQNRFICSAFVIAGLFAGYVVALNVQQGYQYKITPETLHLSPIFYGHMLHELSVGD